MDYEGREAVPYLVSIRLAGDEAPIMSRLSKDLPAIKGILERLSDRPPEIAMNSPDGVLTVFLVFSKQPAFHIKGAIVGGPGDKGSPIKIRDQLLITELAPSVTSDSSLTVFNLDRLKTWIRRG